MLKKRKIALFIQFTLIVSIAVVFFITFRSIQSDSNQTNNMGGLQNSLDGCPARIIRKCCSRVYCSEVNECPLTLNECNLQKDLTSCLQYQWKDTSSPGLCKNCDQINSDSITLKIRKTCK